MPRTLKTRSVLATGARPNGAAIVKRLSLGIAACIGDEKEAPTLQAFRLNDGQRVKLDLPGRPRWCVTDAAAERLFLCIREPSMILVVEPAGPAPARAMAASFRRRAWPRHRSRARTSLRRMRCRRSRRGRQRIRRGHQRLAHRRAAPDVTFFNPATGRVHVAIGEPGLVETVDPKTGKSIRTITGAGRAHHGAGAAGSALRDFTGAWWSSSYLTDT